MPPKYKPAEDLTRLLQAWSEGDRDAFNSLIERVYPSLRKTAHRYLEGHGSPLTLQTTAVVHEVWLRLNHQTRTKWQHRAQFFAFTGQLMRRILIDYIRARFAQKRGDNLKMVPLEKVTNQAAIMPDELAILSIDEGLVALKRIDSNLVDLVEQRFFVGLTFDEIAALEGTSPTTVKRRWSVAKRWLARHLEGVGSETES